MKKKERTVHVCCHHFDLEKFPVLCLHVIKQSTFSFWQNYFFPEPTLHPSPSYISYARPFQLSHPSSCSASNFVLLLPPFQIMWYSLNQHGVQEWNEDIWCLWSKLCHNICVAVNVLTLVALNIPSPKLELEWVLIPRPCPYVIHICHVACSRVPYLPPLLPLYSSLQSCFSNNCCASPMSLTSYAVSHWQLILISKIFCPFGERQTTFWFV